MRDSALHSAPLAGITRARDSKHGQPNRGDAEDDSSHAVRARAPLVRAVPEWKAPGGRALHFGWSVRVGRCALPRAASRRAATTALGFAGVYQGSPFMSMTPVGHRSEPSSMIIGSSGDLWL